MAVDSSTVEQIRQAMRRQLTRRLEEGMRSACNFICNVLKEVVSRPSTGRDLFGPAPGGIFRWHPRAHTDGPYLYGSPLGREHFRYTNAGGYVYREGQPPYMRTGNGVQSIGFQIIEVDEVAGVVKARVGTDASAPGGSTSYRSYLMLHEYGIRYPTVGPAKGTGPRLYRKWLRPTIRRYMPEMNTIISASMGVPR